jgi:hypothetical protein
MHKRGDIVDYSPECAAHLGLGDKPCPSTRFKFDVERPGAEDDYVCVVCGARVIGDDDCLAVNRRHKRTTSS